MIEVYAESCNQACDITWFVIGSIVLGLIIGIAIGFWQGYNSCRRHNEG